MDEIVLRVMREGVAYRMEELERIKSYVKEAEESLRTWKVRKITLINQITALEAFMAGSNVERVDK